MGAKSGRTLQDLFLFVPDIFRSGPQQWFHAQLSSLIRKMYGKTCMYKKFIYMTKQPAMSKLHYRFLWLSLQNKNGKISLALCIILSYLFKPVNRIVGLRA